jgi:hypothetical protein
MLPQQRPALVQNEDFSNRELSAVASSIAFVMLRLTEGERVLRLSFGTSAKANPFALLLWLPALPMASVLHIVFQPNECRAFTTIDAQEVGFRFPCLILFVAP